MLLLFDDITGKCVDRAGSQWWREGAGWELFFFSVMVNEVREMDGNGEGRHVRVKSLVNVQLMAGVVGGRRWNGCGDLYCGQQVGV